MITTQTSKDRFSKDAWILCILPSLAVLSAMLLVSGWVWLNAKSGYEQERSRATTNTALALQNLIVNRLGAYEEIMRGGAGLLASSESVTKDEWKTFISTYQVADRYPGIQSIGYLPIINSTDRLTYAANAQQNGMPGYTIFPATDQNTSAPILYVEPQSEANLSSVGYDAFSEPIRRDSLLRAGSTGQPVITGKVPPRANATLPPTPTFVMYYPIYDKTCLDDYATKVKNCTVKGYIYAGFRMNNLMKGIISNDPLFDRYFAIYDGTNKTTESLLYASAANRGALGAATKSIDLYSRKWTLEIDGIASDMPLTAGDRVTYVLVGALTISFVTSGTIFSTLVKRFRKLRKIKDVEVQMAKDELLALAAHQLRTPATAVKQYIIMAMEGYGGDLNDQQAELVRKAYENNERQLRTVNEMLYVANADAGKLRLLLKEIDLVRLIKEAIEEQSEPLKEKKHTLVVRLPSTPLHYKVDELYMRMAVGNILSNAIKYTYPNGKIVVALRLTPKNINITIRDNGVGITKKQLPYLFQQFSRLDNSLSNQTMGTGLGLYLANKIVNLHAGTIKVISSKTGTLFSIVLPRNVHTITTVKELK